MLVVSELTFIRSSLLPAGFITFLIDLLHWKIDGWIDRIHVQEIDIY